MLRATLPYLASAVLIGVATGAVALIRLIGMCFAFEQATRNLPQTKTLIFTHDLG